MLALVMKDWWSFSVCVAFSAVTCTDRVVASGSRTHSLSHGKHDALNYGTHANARSQAPLALFDLLAADAAAAAAACCLLLLLMQFLLWLLLLLLRLSRCRIRE